VVSRQRRPAVHAVAGRKRMRSSPCDHEAPSERRIESTHRTSQGTVAYARCACGAWLVLLDDQLRAATDPAATDPRRAGSTAIPLSLDRGTQGKPVT
jgi:hypothetical protein